MGLKKRIQNTLLNKPIDNYELANRSISGSDVTEESLQAWLALPAKIRHDPSLASFQIEHERLHGHAFDDGDEQDDKQADENDNDAEKSEFISMNITKSQVEIEQVDTSKDFPQSREIHTDVKRDEHESCLLTNTWQRNMKIAFLLLIWLAFTMVLAQKNEKEISFKHTAVPEFDHKYFYLTGNPLNSKILIQLEGPFQSIQDTAPTRFLSVTLESYNHNLSKVLMVPEIWKLPLVSSNLIDISLPIMKKKIFDISSLQTLLDHPESLLRIKFETNSNIGLAVNVGYDMSPMSGNAAVIYAMAILILMYLLIIFEIVHRTFAAILSSVTAIGVLAILNDRPTMVDIITWMDMDTLLLLFSMMILVAVLTETGVFDYIAVYTFKIANGKIWPLIHSLCIVTALVSSFLDNVTTVLLMTPVSMRLCEVMHLNPVPVLMAIVLHANIGGTITPVGDPPNIMITNNPYIAKHGVSFLTFTLHMTVGVILVLIQTAIQLRIQYHDIHALRIQESKEIKEMRREINVWKRAAATLPSMAKKGDIVRETLLAKVKFMTHKLRKMELSGTDSKEIYKCTLDELKQAYPIKNKVLLIKSSIVLVCVIALFFIQSVPNWNRLTLGWCALLGVILLIILAEKDDMDTLMHRIEWTTLIFFAAMFVTMECLERLGLINWIGKQSEFIILSVSEEARLAVAIMIILWVSAITSAFVDTIPVTAMMVKIVVSLGENQTLGLPYQPLVWALAFGPCLGGNGTLYGASANVICAGIAEQHGYKIGFMEYMKVCFPIMIGSIVVITGYLMGAHILFTWH